MSAAAPLGARLDAVAQAGSDSRVEVPSSAPSHPMSLHPHPPLTSCSSPNWPGSLQPPGLCLRCSFCLESHCLFSPCTTLPLSVQTVDMDSSKECSLSCPLWIPTHRRGHSEGLWFSPGSQCQDLYRAGLRVYLVRGLQMKGNELPVLEGLSDGGREHFAPPSLASLL